MGSGSTPCKLQPQEASDGIEIVSSGQILLVVQRLQDVNSSCLPRGGGGRRGETGACEGEGLCVQAYVYTHARIP